MPSCALTPNQERAKKVVEKYYEKLELCAQKPEDFTLQKEIERMFTPGGWVFNDLLELKKNYKEGNRENNIAQYLSTMLGLSMENMKFTITAKIDDSSWEEQLDMSLDDKGTAYNVWVTVEKKVFLLGKNTPLFTNKETIKVKEGVIHSIKPPSEGTNEIDFFKLYNEKEYDKAFDLCLKRVLDGKADQDTYFYLGLMFRKGRGCKDKYASAIRDKLCVYYWQKSYRGKEGLLNLGWLTKRYYLNNDPLYPIKFDLMPVYKGDGESYGFMNTKGRMVIPYQYKFAFCFADNGMAMVRFKDMQWGFIDTKGNSVSKRYKDLGKDGFVNGYCIIIDNNGLQGFIDENSNEVVRPQYYLVKNIRNGVFSCMEKKGDKMGFKNLSGQWVLPPTYDYIDDFQSNGLAFVYKTDSNYKIEKIGIIDEQGHLVLPIKYVKVSILNDGNTVRVQETSNSTVEEFPLFSY